MEPISQFPFSKLPNELILLIFKYAAQPTFDQDERYKSKSPYSPALTLCLVSKLARRAVLPELLHTVLLPKSDNLKMFVRALLMQKQYEEIRNNLQLNCGDDQTPNDLYFKYTPHVHKIWIDACYDENIVPDDFFPPDYAPARQVATSALNTVLSTVQSVALSWEGLKLLSECLEHAWKSGTDTNANDQHFPPPWNTRTLTMFGWSCCQGMWKFLDTPQGSAFLSSISHLTFGSEDNIIFDDRFFDPMDGGSPRDYHLPSWMKRIPWLSFENLQTFSISYPHLKPPFVIRYKDWDDFEGFSRYKRGGSNHVELLMLPAALLKNYYFRNIYDSWLIKGFTGVEPGKTCIQIMEKERVSLKLSHFPVQFWQDPDNSDWEKVWALGLHV
ncbi:hypothetical protein EDD22DRAFT_1050723 [Suillus occidentalis]|nr:hypothetical protein EDD22DRAFT_1050723 [Suillus occidentalis]